MSARVRSNWWLAVGLAFAVIAGGNFVFHQLIARAFFDAALRGIALPTAQLAPWWPAAIYALSAVLTVEACGGGAPVQAALRRCSAGGALLGLLSFGTWNAMNFAWLPAWPAQFALVDGAWHALLGGLAGAAAGAWLRRAR